MTITIPTGLHRNTDFFWRSKFWSEPLRIVDLEGLESASLVNTDQARIPAASAARMMASLRSIRPVAKAVLREPHGLNRLSALESYSNGKGEVWHSLLVGRD